MVFPQNWEGGWLSWLAELEGETPAGELNTALAVGEVDPPTSKYATPSSMAGPSVVNPQHVARAGDTGTPPAVARQNSQLVQSLEEWSAALRKEK